MTAVKTNILSLVFIYSLSIIKAVDTLEVRDTSSVNIKVTGIGGKIRINISLCTLSESVGTDVLTTLWLRWSARRTTVACWETTKWRCEHTVHTLAVSVYVQPVGSDPVGSRGMLREGTIADDTVWKIPGGQEAALLSFTPGNRILTEFQICPVVAVILWVLELSGPKSTVDQFDSLGDQNVQINNIHIYNIP